MSKSIVAIVVVYLIAVVGWIALGGTITNRTALQDIQLKQEVGQLWGTPLDQRSPWASLSIDTAVQPRGSVEKGKTIVWARAEPKKVELPIIQNDISVG